MKTAGVDADLAILPHGILSLVPKVFANGQHGIAEGADPHIPRNEIEPGEAALAPLMRAAHAPRRLYARA